MPSKSAAKTSKEESNQVLGLHLTAPNIYLIGYNVLQLLGWAIILIQTTHYVLYNGLDTENLWKETNLCLKIFQTLALLEILHTVTGIVKSSVVTTTIQLFSRVFVVWGICNAVQAAQLSIGLLFVLITWSITEVIRYSFYFLNILKFAPSVLIYLRYTLFIVLYPLGVIGEQLCIYVSLPYIYKNKLFTYSMPNTLNFAFDFYYFCIVLMLLYIVFFPQLYLHMFSQRRKVLGGTGSDKKKN